jgi:hypothetical protein
VTINPGAASSSSPGRVTGRVSSSLPGTVIWLAMDGATGGPLATLGAPEFAAGAGEGWGAWGAGAGGPRWGARATRLRAVRVTTVIVGSCVASAGGAVGLGTA